jgi:hypothetical protein
MVLICSVLKSLDSLSYGYFDTRSEQSVFDSATRRGICRMQPCLILQGVIGTVPATVIYQTALLNYIDFKCSWVVAACPSAPVTVHHSVAIQGTTYSANPFEWNIYPDGWTVTLGYQTIALDIVTTYHTATIVRVPTAWHPIDF